MESVTDVVEEKDKVICKIIKIEDGKVSASIRVRAVVLAAVGCSNVSLRGAAAR